MQAKVTGAVCLRSNTPCLRGCLNARRSVGAGSLLGSSLGQAESRLRNAPLLRRGNGAWQRQPSLTGMRTIPRYPLSANIRPHGSTGTAEGQGLRRGFLTNPSLRPLLASMSRYAERCWAAHALSAAKCSGVSHGQLPTMRSHLFFASTQASRVVTGNRDPTNPCTPPMISGSLWMSGGVVDVMTGGQLWARSAKNLSALAARPPACVLCSPLLGRLQLSRSGVRCLRR